ncbi:hypothetical protein B0H13DRAFT_2539983 [Mycena leptocephala]|nr:hypothetical protein B0H13DRAFT_2539983 [Mycena leptocephala]
MRRTLRFICPMLSSLLAHAANHLMQAPDSDPFAVSFSSNDARILSFSAAELPNFRIVDDLGALSVLLHQDNTFTVNRPTGVMCGLPVAAFSVRTSSRDQVTALLRHIAWFHALLARVRNMDDGSAVLRMHSFADTQVGADLVERRADAISAVALFHSRDEPDQYYCFSLRNEGCTRSFRAHLLSLDPELYEVSVWDVGAAPLSVGEECLVGAGVEDAFRFSLTPGVHEDSGFMLLAGMPPEYRGNLGRAAPITAVGSGRHKLTPSDEGTDTEIPPFLAAAVISVTVKENLMLTSRHQLDCLRYMLHPRVLNVTNAPGAIRQFIAGIGIFYVTRNINA